MRYVWSFATYILKKEKLLMWIRNEKKNNIKYYFLS